MGGGPRMPNMAFPPTWTFFCQELFFCRFPVDTQQANPPTRPPARPPHTQTLTSTPPHPYPPARTLSVTCHTRCYIIRSTINGTVHRQAAWHRRANPAAGNFSAAIQNHTQVLALCGEVWPTSAAVTQLSSWHSFVCQFSI